MAADPNAPLGTIEFLQFHQPPLRDGDYRIRVTQTVTSPGKIAGTAADGSSFSTADKTFRVTGERVRLDATEIWSVFPPAGSSGDHAMVLPHLILRRSTLPWERFAADGDEATPWLALLLFDETDMAQLREHVVTFKEIASDPAAGLVAPNLTPEREGPDDQVSVIDVPWAVLSPLAPNRADLRLQAHVRRTFADDGTPDGPELAVLIANRLPEPGKVSVVHLVSVEGWLDPSGALVTSGNASATDAFRFVTLANWRFSCDAATGAFTEKVTALDLDTPYLRVPGGDRADDPMLDVGGVPMRHLLRDGGRTVSIFRGPLAAHSVTATREMIDPRLTTADELLEYHEALGLLDVSYAAAWELGRLLTLRSTRVATELLHWKRREVRRRRRAEQVAERPHLPGHQRDSVETTLNQFPTIVAEWFRDLELLRGVPFNYLVPADEMLPAESMRFFHVDPAWTTALLLGAFSIGRATSGDRRDDTALLSGGTGTPSAMSGVLIRSAVVDGWPDLLVDAHGVTANDPSDHPLSRLRLERLSPHVLLALFEGSAHTIDIHLKPESLHFGLDVDETARPPEFVKRLRNTLGDDAGAIARPIPWGRGGFASRRVDMAALAGSIAGELTRRGALPDIPPDGALPSSLFALEMIEGVQNVRFVLP